MEIALTHWILESRGHFMTKAARRSRYLKNQTGPNHSKPSPSFLRYHALLSASLSSLFDEVSRFSDNLFPKNRF